MVLRDFGRAESKEGLEIRDFQEWRLEKPREKRLLGLLACAVAEVIIMSENLEIKCAILWPLSCTEAKLFAIRQQGFNETSEFEEEKRLEKAEFRRERTMLERRELREQAE